MAAFLLSLLVTLLIEVTLLILLSRLDREAQPSLGKTVRAGLLASTATLPYLWFVFPEMLSGWGYYVAELCVVVFEGEILVFTLGLTHARAMAYALVCNAASSAATPVVGRILDTLGVQPY